MFPHPRQENNKAKAHLVVTSQTIKDTTANCTYILHISDLKSAPPHTWILSILPGLVTETPIYNYPIIEKVLAQEILWKVPSQAMLMIASSSYILNNVSQKFITYKLQELIWTSKPNLNLLILTVKLRLHTGCLRVTQWLWCLHQNIWSLSGSDHLYEICEHPHKTIREIVDKRNCTDMNNSNRFRHTVHSCYFIQAQHVCWLKKKETLPSSLRKVMYL